MKKFAIHSLTELIQKECLEDYTGWLIETRKSNGASLVRMFTSLFGALKHPIYASLDLTWVPEFLKGIPTEPAAVALDRRAARCVHFSVLEPIPSMIQAERLAEEKGQLRDRQRAGSKACDVKRRVADAKTTYQIALLAMNELLIKFILYLPMRQLNIRELAFGKSLFYGPIPRLKNITIPGWAQKKLDENPAAEFWQIRFESRNTKKGNTVHCVVPWALIQLLEEYRTKYRPHLLLGPNPDKPFLGPDPETLFLNRVGKALDLRQMTNAISGLTLVYAKERITPHSFRHIAAYRWLELNPKDYLTLSKMLWHSSVDVTLRIYGAGFNESDGVCRWEQMLDNGGAGAP